MTTTLASRAAMSISHARASDGWWCCRRYRASGARAGARSTTTTRAATFGSRTDDQRHGVAVDDDDDDDGDDALLGVITIACARVGRTSEDAYVVLEALRAQWYDDVDAVRALTSDEARACGVPARLWTAMRAVMDEDVMDSSDRRGADGSMSTSTSMSHAEDGWIGGELPSGDARVPVLLKPVAAMALADVRVTTRKRLKPYGLRGDEVTKELEQDIDRMVRDLTQRRVGGGRAPVRPRTAMNHAAVAYQFLGWLCRESQHRSQFATVTDEGKVLLKPGVSIKDAFPSADSQGAKYAIEYVQWLADERKIKSTTEDFQLRSLVALAKWVTGHVEDELAPAVVQELIRVQRSARERAKNAPHAADDKRKWLEWDDYLTLVETLKLECAPNDCDGKPRSERDVAMSVQRYLLFAILACIPDRQRTLRELQLDKTLIKNAQTGEWMVRHGPDDYKTGSAYGERPALVIDQRVYPALEAWLSTHRARLAPAHDFCFTRPNGSPWTVSELSRTFSRTALRITGQKTNPHLIRDMIVTHVRAQGVASDAELEALAALMGHSPAMQKSTYDRRTAQDKVNPAVGLMSTINRAKTPKQEDTRPLQSS